MSLTIAFIIFIIILFFTDFGLGLSFLATLGVLLVVSGIGSSSPPPQPQYIVVRSSK